MRPAPSGTRTSEFRQNSGLSVADELRNALSVIANEGAAVSERVSRALRQGIDTALLHLQARRVFSDPDTRQWVAETRKAVAAGQMTGLSGDELRQALDARRKPTAK